MKRRLTALWLVIALLICLLLPGCGKKDTLPAGSDGLNTTVSQNTGAQDGTASTNSAGAENTATDSTSATDNTPNKAVKNVIFMIADGGGYDNYTLAGKVKEEMVSRGLKKLGDAKTEITTNLLSGLGKDKVKGLYLNEFLVGSVNTLLVTPHGDAGSYKSYITDSAAAGTALSSGYKTTYCYVGIDSDKTPRASLPELARLNDMATGIVTTKSYVDATPMTFFTSHSINRYEYQENSMQALFSGIDVVIAEGTEYGDLVESKPSSHSHVSASSMGYTVAKNKTDLLKHANDPAVKKLWAPILGVSNSTKELKTTDWDLASSHITYDVDAKQSSEQPSLLDMTKAALQVLGSNIDDPDGFFLMIEGGALDNAAESGYFLPTVGEYLAFDEAFGYCVNWAAQRGDTIVIATADHDSGGFSGIEKCESQLIDGIINRKIGAYDLRNTTHFDSVKEMLNLVGGDSSQMALHSGHTDMAVPLCVYAPDSVKTELLTQMGLPTEKGDVRTGSSMYYVPNASGNFSWYSSSALNNDYTIENTKIAPALAKVLKLGTLEEATNILYNKICAITDGKSTGDLDGKIVFEGDVFENSYAKYRDCLYANSNTKFYVERNSLPVGLSLIYKNDWAHLNNMPLRSIFVLDERLVPENGSFYVSYNQLTAIKLAWSVTINYTDRKMPTVLLSKPNEAITLPDTPGVTYTDGTHTYNPGDTIPYNGSNIQLTAK